MLLDYIYPVAGVAADEDTSALSELDAWATVRDPELDERCAEQRAETIAAIEALGPDMAALLLCGADR